MQKKKTDTHREREKEHKCEKTILPTWKTETWNIEYSQKLFN